MAKSAGCLSRATKASREPKELQPGPNIAAIDFGTSSVSLAYCINKGDVQTLKIDSGDFGRVPNAILIKKPEGGETEYKTNAFGQRAHSRYRDLHKNDRVKYVYFERVKVLLKRDDSHEVNRETPVMSFDKTSYYLVEVIAFIINYLKDLLMNSLTKLDHGNNAYKSTDFDWVLTVPAIWDASSKRMMREAAYMAGLTSDDLSITTLTPCGSPITRPRDINPNKLFLVLEPEVAAIFAQNEIESSRKIKPPHRYMVVDIGGGTVDITVHDMKDGKIDVVLPPNGNMWGGFTVNEAFKKLLGELVKDEGFSKYQKKHPDDFMSINHLIYVDVESQKKKLGDTCDSDDDFVIRLPDSFVKFYEKKLRKKVNRGKIPGFEYDKGNLRIKYFAAKERFLQRTINNVVCSVEKSFNKVNEKVEIIYLVGGFGGCAMMHKEIEEGIKDCKGARYDNIVRPSMPHLAVVKGAVMWRQNPSIIHSRRADATYGIEVAPIFDESKHDKIYQFNDEDGKSRCNYVFKVFIEEGETAEINRVFTSAICPPSQGDTQMTIPLYSTSRPGVQYTREKDGRYIVEQIGQLIIDIPNDSGKPRVERLVEVSMSFSGAEIRAKAKYHVTGEEVNVVCDFLSQRPKDITKLPSKYAESAV